MIKYSSLFFIIINIQYQFHNTLRLYILSTKSNNYWKQVNWDKIKIISNNMTLIQQNKIEMK